MNEQPKIYAPVSAKMNTFASGKQVLKLGINVEKFKAFLDEHKNERGYVNVGISERRQEGSFGETHTVWLDTWKPDSSKISTPENRAPSEPVERRTPAIDHAPKTSHDDDVPF